MSGRLIAVIDWRAGSQLKDNARFREGKGKGSARQRSLVLWEDGTAELWRFSPAAAVRRLGGTIVQNKRGKAGTKQRG